MTIGLALLLAASLGLNAWLLLFLVVLRCDRFELAPRRSGGGSPSSHRRLAPTATSTILTPRKLAAREAGLRGNPGLAA